MKQRKITIGGKKYTLTANRSLIKVLYNISPKFLSMNTIEDEEERKKVNAEVSVSVVAGLDELFYAMIKVAQPTITKDKSDEILEKFEAEYDDVQGELINFTLSVFQQGDQTKKKIVWE